MSALNIHYVPNSLLFSKDIALRKSCRALSPEEIKESWFKDLLNDMFATLYSSPSGIGLAAPQIGVHLQVSVIDVSKNGTNPIVLINPKYEAITEEKIISSNECCLSIPNYKADVLRYKTIKVNYLDINGNEIESIVDGKGSFVFQHEIDHLSGKLYIDLIESESELQTTLGRASNLANYVLKNLYLQ